MNARVYLNTSSLAWSERLDGGTWSAPTVRAYSDLIVRFRLARDLEGVTVPDEREVLSVSARVGWPDRPPAEGGYQLLITEGSDSVTTAALAHDATAAELKSAIDAALTAGETPPLEHLAPVRVGLYAGAYRISFADQSATVDVEAADNELWPLSFVEADRIEWDEGWATILSLRQAPVAEVASAIPTVPPLPSVTREQGGSTEGGVALNEVQRITFPPAYAGGALRIVREGRKGDILPGFPTLEELQAALDGLADPGGQFALVPVEGGVFVEFRGSMGGIGHPLLEVEEFAAPPAELLVKIPTATAAMRTLMRGADDSGEIDVPLDFVVTVDDPDAPGGTQTLKFRQTVTFQRPVSDDSRNVSPALDWTQPLARRSNLKFSPTSILVGNRAKRFVLGDDAATSFVLNHGLGASVANFTANASTDTLTSAGHGLANGDPITLSTTGTLPAPLVEGVTYWVLSATDDTYQLSALPGGGAIDLTAAGSGTHTHAMADGTADGVFVEVWERAGDRERLPQDAYTVRRTTADSLTLIFPDAPGADEYVALVQTAGRPATYQAHQHPLDELPDTKARIEAIEARLEALEAQQPTGLLPAAAGALQGAVTRPLRRVWEVLRSRVQVPEPPSLLDWQPYGEGSPLRPSRLLPAVVTTSAPEPLPATLPEPGPAFAGGRIFTTAVERLDFPGGLRAGDHAACDGREWFRVVRYDESESTWYPAAYELELFRTPLNGSLLAARSRAEVRIGFECAIFPGARRSRDRRTAGTWTLLLETGEWTGETSPGTPGANLDQFFTDPVAVVSQRIHLAETPAAHRFGLRVDRAADGAITARATVYGREIACPAPSGPDFAIRARLVRWDTENPVPDARGLVAVRGLDVGGDGGADVRLGALFVDQ